MDPNPPAVLQSATITPVVNVASQPDSARFVVSILWVVLIGWIVSFEWLVSAYNKFSSVEYLDKFGSQMQDIAMATPFPFFGSFLNHVVVPNATRFAYLVKFGELSVGIVTLLGGLAMLVPSLRGRGVYLATAAAFFVGALMTSTFFMIVGWKADPFDEGVGVDIVLALLQTILGFLLISFAIRKDK